MAMEPMVAMTRMTTIGVMVGTSTVVMGVIALPQLSLLMTQWMMIVVMMSVAAG